MAAPEAPARALRSQGDRSRTPPPLVPRWHLAAHRRPASYRRIHRRRTHRQHRLHHRACPPARRRGREKGNTVRGEPDGREALGRSRGGLTVKIHLLTDQHRHPWYCHALGHRGDSPMFEPLMGALRLARRTGGPRTRLDRILGEKAYSSRANREHLRYRGNKTTIAQPCDQCETPSTSRVGGRQASGFRPGDLPGPQHGGAGAQPASAEPGGRDPL